MKIEKSIRHFVESLRTEAAKPKSEPLKINDRQIKRSILKFWEETKDMVPTLSELIQYLAFLGYRDFEIRTYLWLHIIDKFLFLGADWEIKSVKSVDLVK